MRSPIAPIVALAALAALALPPAHAAHAERESKSASVPAPDEPERSAKRENRAEERAGGDLVSCKRDADGMRGPERSRFMTQCLRERK